MWVSKLGRSLVEVWCRNLVVVLVEVWSMVNKLFTRQADGSYTLNLQDTMCDAIVYTLTAWVHLDTWIHLDRL